MFNSRMRRMPLLTLSYCLILTLVFGSVALAQTTGSAAQTTRPEVGTATIVTSIPDANVNVRQGPSMEFPILRTVRPDTRVGVLGQSGAAWLAIRLPDGTEGWVARFLTDFTETVPDVPAPVLETPVIVQPQPVQPQPVQPPLAPPAAQIALTQVPTAPPAWVTLVHEPHAVTIVTLVPVNVNVREGPSTAHRVLRTVAPGTQVTAVAQDATNLWLQIRLPDGSHGWVARYLTNFIGTVPVTTATAVSQPPLAPPVSAPIAETDTVTTEPGVMMLPGEQRDLVDPPVAQALDQNWRTLPQGQLHWYSFNHPGDNMPIQVWMDSEPNEGAGFRIYNAAQAHAIMAGRSPDDFDAVGRGTPNPYEPGNLFWRGEFSVAGTYYVMVEPGGLGDIPYTIYGAGPGFH